MVIVCLPEHISSIGHCSSHPSFLLSALCIGHSSFLNSAVTCIPAYQRFVFCQCVQPSSIHFSTFFRSSFWCCFPFCMSCHIVEPCFPLSVNFNLIFDGRPTADCPCRTLHHFFHLSSPLKHSCRALLGVSVYFFGATSAKTVHNEPRWKANAFLEGLIEKMCSCQPKT